MYQTNEGSSSARHQAECERVRLEEERRAVELEEERRQRRAEERGRLAEERQRRIELRDRLAGVMSSQHITHYLAGVQVCIGLNYLIC